MFAFERKGGRSHEKNIVWYRSASAKRATLDLTQSKKSRKHMNNAEHEGSARGIIAVDKMGMKVLFLNPVTFETEVADDFPRTVHELLRRA
jgi:hypothetical protein